MDRNCDKCIHHTSGMCDSWDCKMQTVEGLKKEVRAKAIEEFAEKLKEKSTFLKSLQDDYYGYVFEDEIDEIAKELKGE
jgi:hypothetical protein